MERGENLLGLVTALVAHYRADEREAKLADAKTLGLRVQEVQLATLAGDARQLALFVLYLVSLAREQLLEQIEQDTRALYLRSPDPEELATAYGRARQEPRFHPAQAGLGLETAAAEMFALARTALGAGGGGGEVLTSDALSPLVLRGSGQHLVLVAQTARALLVGHLALRMPVPAADRVVIVRLLARTAAIVAARVGTETPEALRRAVVELAVVQAAVVSRAGEEEEAVRLMLTNPLDPTVEARVPLMWRAVASPDYLPLTLPSASSPGRLL